MRAAAEDRLDIALLARMQLRAVHIFADAGEAFEIGVDVVGRLVARDAEAARQAECGNAVDDPEIDRLRVAPDHRVHALDRNAEHLGCRHRVNIDAVGKGLLQLRDVGNVREQAQLDLRIVGGQEDVPCLRNEGLADLRAFLGADRDVLQIGIGGGEAPGGRCGQREAGVDAVRARIDRRDQRIGIGGL